MDSNPPAQQPTELQPGDAKPSVIVVDREVLRDRPTWKLVFLFGLVCAGLTALGFWYSGKRAA